MSHGVNLLLKLMQLSAQPRQKDVDATGKSGIGWDASNKARS
jgi:hypothetical protein